MSAFRQFGNASCTKEYALDLEERTRDQSESDLWRLVRQFKLTASRFGDALANHRATTSPEAITRRLLYPNPRISFFPAVRHGKLNEPLVLLRYEDFCKRSGRNISLQKDVGIFVCTEPGYGCLAASPDAIATDHDKEDSQFLIEVKCLYDLTSNLKTVADVARKRRSSFFCNVDKASGKLTLKQNHAYFYQIMAQLGILQKDYCLLLISYKRDLRFVRVDYNEEVWKDIKNRAKNAYVKYMLPEICAHRYV